MKEAEIIPKECGIIAVTENDINGISQYKAKWFRQCKKDLKIPKPDDKTVKKFMSLGCMRIWSLKIHNSYKQSKQ